MCGCECVYYLVYFVCFMFGNVCDVMFLIMFTTAFILFFFRDGTSCTYEKNLVFGV